jgi:hypothetical protein
MVPVCAIINSIKEIFLIKNLLLIFKLVPSFVCLQSISIAEPSANRNIEERSNRNNNQWERIQFILNNKYRFI